MSVSSIGRILPSVAVGGAGVATAHDNGFIIPANTAAAASAGAGASRALEKASPVSASLMLALQETVTSEAGDREARQHGQKLLAALAELQHALLSDGGGDVLQRLLLLTQTAPHTIDPELGRAINSIRLRARIELARASAATEGVVRSTV